MAWPGKCFRATSTKPADLTGGMPCADYGETNLEGLIYRKAAELPEGSRPDRSLVPKPIPLSLIYLYPHRKYSLNSRRLDVFVMKRNKLTPAGRSFDNIWSGVNSLQDSHMTCDVGQRRFVIFAPARSIM